MASPPRSLARNRMDARRLAILDPASYVMHHFAKPHVEIARPGVMFPEEIKPVMAYLRTHERSGDLTYLFYGSQSAWQYYAERNVAPQGNIVMGTASGDDSLTTNPILIGCVAGVRGSFFPTPTALVPENRKRLSSTSKTWEERSSTPAVAPAPPLS